MSTRRNEWVVKMGSGMPIKDAKKLKLDVTYRRGFAVSKSVSVVVNSANGFLLLGTSGAGAIRERSQPLTPAERHEYKRLLNRLPRDVKNDYIRVYRERGWRPTYAQLGCLRLLVAKPGNRFRRGDAVLQKEWSRSDARPLIHAVGMSYRLRMHDSSRLPATDASIRNSVRKSLAIADRLGARSIALPVMCARPTYGLGPETSFRIIRKTIDSFRGSSLRRAVLCFDNKVTSDFLARLSDGKK